MSVGSTTDGNTWPRCVEAEQEASEETDGPELDRRVQEVVVAVRVGRGECSVVRRKDEHDNRAEPDTGKEEPVPSTSIEADEQVGDKHRGDSHTGRPLYKLMS